MKRDVCPMQRGVFKGLSPVVILLSVMLFNAGCQKEEDLPDPIVDKSEFLTPFGVFIVNEGQFMSGNGDISFYNKQKREVQNGLFSDVNNRPPGDIPQHLTFYQEEAWLVVNNSNAIEVVDLNDFKSVTTLQGLDMPRRMAVVGHKGYVSQIGSGDIVEIDLKTRQVIGYLSCGKSTDDLKVIGNRLFAANWTSYFIDKPNNTIMVFDLTTKQLIDSVVVAKEPNSMVVDHDGMLWVLSSGGFMGEEYPALTRINPNTLQVIHTFEFSSKQKSPTLLTISPDRETLYYVDGDVFALDVKATVLPDQPLIASDGIYVYGLASDPETGDIYLTDPRDFQVDGQVLRYSKDGIQLDAFDAGINPSGIFFYDK